ncbi:MAG: hypothetical protein CMF62_01595 [Magnetococcales bacterium]|nr:hypothetical protein [Magnetococcales bacterium]|tara:strand:+ start:47936 stop:48925 length:990 start_codon:yes stop_codon:yes gene_type:complete
MVNEEFYNSPLESIYYISIGSAANLYEKKIFKLKDKDNHQFPPFLKKINEKFPLKNINILLIDPCLASPPYIVNRKWTKYDTYYQNDNIKVFCLNKYISYFDFQHDFNMLNFLVNFVKFIKKNKHYLFYHDFTGKDCNFLNEKFKDDRILFDISRGDDQGCYFDLNLSEYNPFIFKSKIFKPETMTKGKLQKYYNKDKLFRIQISSSLQNNLQEFKQFLRLCRKLKLDKKNIEKGIEPSFDFIKLETMKKISYLYEVPIDELFLNMLQFENLEKYLSKICEIMDQILLLKLSKLFMLNRPIKINLEDLHLFEKIVEEKYKIKFGHLLEN